MVALRMEILLGMDITLVRFLSSNVIGLEYYRWVLDFINGWERGVLQRAVNECKCNPYGDVSFIPSLESTRMPRLNTGTNQRQ